MSDRKQNRTVIGTDRLQEIRARLEGISWVSDEFVAHAPADIAWLLDEVERLRSRLVVEMVENEKIGRGALLTISQNASAD